MQVAAAKKVDLKNQLLAMNEKRNELEKEIKLHQEILSTQGVGMSEPLVDNEGFPRNDVDIWQVRTARHKITTLTNDCKDLMKQIETKLHELHSLAANDGNGPSR